MSSGLHEHPVSISQSESHSSNEIAQVIDIMTAVMPEKLPTYASADKPEML